MERIRHETEQRAALKRIQDEREKDKQRKQVKEPKWGSAEAKRREIERVRAEIEARKK